MAALLLYLFMHKHIESFTTDRTNRHCDSLFLPVVTDSMCLCMNQCKSKAAVRHHNATPGRCRLCCSATSFCCLILSFLAFSGLSLSVLFAFSDCLTWNTVSTPVFLVVTGACRHLSLELLLGTEAPVMMPHGVDFSSSFFRADICFGWVSIHADICFGWQKPRRVRGGEGGGHSTACL